MFLPSVNLITWYGMVQSSPMVGLDWCGNLLAKPTINAITSENRSSTGVTLPEQERSPSRGPSFIKCKNAFESLDSSLLTWSSRAIELTKWAPSPSCPAVVSRSRMTVSATRLPAPRSCRARTASRNSAGETAFSGWFPAHKAEHLYSLGSGQTSVERESRFGFGF